MIIHFVATITKRDNDPAGCHPLVLETKMQLRCIAEAKLPIPWNDFLIVGFEEIASRRDNI